MISVRFVLVWYVGVIVLSVIMTAATRGVGGLHDQQDNAEEKNDSAADVDPRIGRCLDRFVDYAAGGRLLKRANLAALFNGGWGIVPVAFAGGHE